MDQLHTANKVCGGCCAISLNTVDTESSVSPKTVKWMNPVLCIHVPDSSLYIICVFLFQSDKNSGCYGNFNFP